MIAEIKDDNGKVIGTITLPAKTFKTGSKGYFGAKKLEVNGKRYQAHAQLVEVGSKKA